MTEVRTCVECGNLYTISDYEKSNPKVRDLCLGCLEKKIYRVQEEREGGV